MTPLLVLVNLLNLASFLLFPISAHTIATPKLFGRKAIAALKERNVLAGEATVSAVKRHWVGLTHAKRQTATGQCGPGLGSCGAGICCSPAGKHRECDKSFETLQRS
jgi:hypothetical protein